MQSFKLSTVPAGGTAAFDACPSAVQVLQDQVSHA